MCFVPLQFNAFICQEENDKFTIERGSWYTAGNFSLTSFRSEAERPDNSNNQDSFGFTVSPKLGYSINKNLILGVGIGYSRIKRDLENTILGNPTIIES